MGQEIYYIVERIKKTPNGRIYCIRSSMGTTFEMLVSEEQYARFDIKEGDRIDDAHFLKIREEMIFDNARRHAFAILSYGENNKRSLIQKLRQKGCAKRATPLRFAKISLCIWSTEAILTKRSK